MNFNITRDVELSGNVNIYNHIINRNIDLEPRRLESPETLVRHCVICLDPIINECHTESCLHTFCFECLKRWSTIDPRCPLCMTVFTTIIYSFNNLSSYLTYIVSERRTTITLGNYNDAFAELLRPRENNLSLINVFINIQYDGLMTFYDQNSIMFFPDDFRIPYRHHTVSIGYQRVLIYRNNLWAQQLPNSEGQFRTCSLDFYKEDPAQVLRLSSFILNDVIAIRSIFISEEVFSVEERLTNIEVTNTIMRAVLEHDLRSTNMATSLQAYLGVYSDHFCNELFTFANSSYDMYSYYNIVMYRLASSPERVLLPEVDSPFSGYSRGLYTASSTTPIETITLDSDSDDNDTDQVQPVHNTVMQTLNYQNETVLMDSDSDDIVTDQTHN